MYIVLMGDFIDFLPAGQNLCCRIQRDLGEKLNNFPPLCGPQEGKCQPNSRNLDSNMDLKIHFIIEVTNIGDN